MACNDRFLFAFDLGFFESTRTLFSVGIGDFPQSAQLLCRNLRRTLRRIPPRDFKERLIFISVTLVAAFADQAIQPFVGYFGSARHVYLREHRFSFEARLRYFTWKSRCQTPAGVHNVLKK